MRPPDRHRWWLAAIAVLTAGMIAVLVLVDPLSGRRVYVEIAPWLIVLVIGLSAAGMALAGRAVNRRRQAAARALVAERDGWLAAQAEDHRRFLLRLDHELKNPITALRIGVENVRQVVAAPAGSETDALLSGLAGQSLRLSRLTGDLRKLGALQLEQLDLDQVDVGALLSEIADDAGDLVTQNTAASASGSSASIEVTVALPGGPFPLPAVRADRDLLQLALVNLVSNAIKFSRPESTVEIRAREEAGPTPAVVIEIADTGLGIEPDERDSVWDELARGRSARVLPGTGIGLAVVRTVIGRHGGRCGLRSEPGVGTVVTLWLPTAGPG